MDKQNSLWDTKTFGFSLEEIQPALKLRDWMAKSESKLAKYLAGIQYTSESEDFTKDDVRNLEKLIVRSSATKASALAPLRLLSKVVYRVNHTLQLSIPQPSLAISLTPPKNPFAFDDVALAHRSVRAWLEVEKSWLQNLQDVPAPQRLKNVPFELVLFSAALHSGILSQDLAMSLHAALLDPDKHLRYSDRLYADLSLSWHGKPDQEIRRWYPDDATACLIARFADLTSNGMAEENVAYSDLRRRFCDHTCARLRKELLSRNVENEYLPKSLAEMFERIALFLRSEMPAIMVRFATRELPARSLLSPCIDQIYDAPAAYVIEANNGDEEEDPNAEDSTAYGGEDPRDGEPAWMDGIREVFFGGPTPKDLRGRFDRIQSDSPVAKRIISFARSLLEHGASSGKPLKPNSVKCVVLTVGRRLGPLLEERDPSEFQSERLEDVYVRAIDAAAKDSEKPEHLQGTVAWALREFHCFLVRKHLAGRLNDEDVFRVPRGFPSVDSMIVSVDDIYRALDWLHYEPNPSWSEENRKIAQMEILLGFFAGLRTMEGLGAQQLHFPGGASLPFLVLPSAERDLKTPNAVRMIPVSVCMAPFKDLVEFATSWAQPGWYKERKDPQAKLFGDATDDVIIPMVGEALRAVTGNQRLRYYSLRHAHASWTLARLLISGMPESPNLAPHLPRTSIWLKYSKRFRLQIYLSDRVDNDHAWTVATLLGHSSPRVSFGSYTHTLDILLPEFLRNSGGLEFVLRNRDRLRLSSGFGRVDGYRFLAAVKKRASSDGPLGPVTDEMADADSARQGDSDAELDGGQSTNAVVISVSDCELRRQEEREFALGQIKKRFPNLQAAPVPLATVSSRSWLDQTWGLLYMRVQPDRDFIKLTEFLGLEIDESKRIWLRCQEICRLQSSASGQDLHATVAVTINDVGGTWCYPQRPGGKAIEFARKLADQIAVLAGNPRRHTAQVLDYWSRNVVPKSGSVVFSMCPPVDGKQTVSLETKERVREYCKFLSDLGLQKKSLCYEGACGTSARLAPTTWYKQWGLTRRGNCQIINRSGERAKRIAQGQWLAIGPKREWSDDKRYDFGNRDGFSFAMLLASIRFGG